MPIKITEYLPEQESAVAEFNERMAAHDVEFRLESTAQNSWIPKSDQAPVFIEHFVATEGDVIRGGYKLRCQDFLLNGAVSPMANYQGPLSEGVYSRKHMMVGFQLLRNALKRQPLLYALGMGGLEQPLPTQLAKSGWSMALIPFLFRPLNTKNFLREIQPLRRSGLRRALGNVAALSGLGSLGLKARDLLMKSARLPSGVSCEQALRFGPWADEVWKAAMGKYAFTAVRDQATMNTLFPETNSKNIKLVVKRDEKSIGWAVVRNTQKKDDKYFGNLRLGSIVDCLSLPGEEAQVVESATQFLKSASADLVITNQSHARWTSACKECGYISGPSNFAIGTSPELAERCGKLENFLPQMHFNRADGDGPIHL